MFILSKSLHYTFHGKQVAYYVPSPYNSYTYLLLLSLDGSTIRALMSEKENEKVKHSNY